MPRRASIAAIGAVFVITTLALTLPAHAQSRPSGTIDRALEEGSNLLYKGRLDEAMNRFNTVLVLDPENAEAHYAIGQVYLRKGDMDKALAMLAQSTRLDPNNIRLGFGYATALEQAGQLDEAIAEYQRMVATGSRDKRLKDVERSMTLASGKALAKRGELNAALLVFNGLLLEYGEDPEVLFNIGATYVLLNRVEEAEMMFKKLVRQSPKSAISHLNLANIYERTNRNPEALKHLKAIVDLDLPGDITTMARIKHAIISGREQFKERRWAAALESFERAAAIDPKQTEALFNIGLIHIQLGNGSDAERAFLRVLEATPDDFSARLNLGGFYFDTARVDKAVAQFQYIIDHDKEGRYRNQASLRLNMVHTLLADKALQAGNVEESLREYAKAVDYYSGNVKAFFNQGLILVQQKKYNEAAEAFREVIRVDPNNLRGRLNLATVYEQLNELTQAAEQYQRVLEIDKNSEEGVIAAQKWKITKARGLWLDQKLPEAETVLKEIITEHPDNIEANFYLGLIYSAMGQLRDAASAYQTVLAGRPGNYRIKLVLGKVYEQLELEELAAAEYRAIIFEGAEPDVVAEAKERLAAVDANLSGFANVLGYSFGYDSNITLNDMQSVDEVRSDLSFDITYAQKIRDDLRFQINVKPIYSTYHIGQFDYLSTDVRYTLRQGLPEKNWTLSYVSQSLGGLLTDQTLSRSSNYQVERGMRLFLRPAFGLYPEGLNGAMVSTALNTSFSVRTMQSLGAGAIESWIPTVATSLSQSLKWGVTATAGLALAVRRNVHQSIEFQSLPIPDPISGQNLGESLVKTFDSRDYEFNSIGANLNLVRTLAPGLRGGLAGGISYVGYVNADSSSSSGERRRNMLLSLGTQVLYQFYKNISFFGNASWQLSLSSMRLSDPQQPTVEESIRNFQSNSLGSFNRYMLGGGVTMNF